MHFDDEAWPPEGTGRDEQPALTHIELSVERDALKFLAPAIVKGPG